jgi:hypothetical protein
VPRAWVLPFDDLAVLKGTYARLLIYTPIWTSPEARGAAKWPLTFTVILFIRVTGPFLSRCIVGQAYETLGASN